MIKFINRITYCSHISESGFRFADSSTYDFDPAIKAIMESRNINRFDNEVDSLKEGWDNIWEADDGKFYSVLREFVNGEFVPAIWMEVIKEERETPKPTPIVINPAVREHNAAVIRGEKRDRAFRIKPDHLQEWGADATVNTVVTEVGVITLASDWGKPVDELLAQLEEVDHIQCAAMVLAEDIRNSSTWNTNDLLMLCKLADEEVDPFMERDRADSFEAKWYAAGGENFEAVAYAAAAALGVEI
ncbi:MAG: hypothetical protein MJ074_07175 [Oscillospiraceae bacterium]|nr:hypothetical protein [Oscillospiraceae bacterium]